MLAKKDWDHIVRANAFAIGRWALKSEVEVLEALKVLSSPDKRRIEPQPHEGRRIEKVEDGWLILNGEYYRNMTKAAHRASYQAKWQAEKRAKERLLQKVGKGTPLSGEEAAVRAFEHGDEDGFDKRSEPNQGELP
jgi:cell division protein YceG involved in septum cleavage